VGSLDPSGGRLGLLVARSRKRLPFALGLSLVIGLLIPDWNDRTGLLIRTLTLGLVATGAFGLFEQWPRRLPAWLARWVLQVTGVGLAMPLTTLAFYQLSTPPAGPPFWHVADRLTGFVTLTFLGVLLAPWMALAALVREKDALARSQRLAFELERSEYERRALDARLHLLQAQVTPHFLFNTLANIQALVDARSPRASEVVRSLVAYLRAAMPLLHEPVAGLGREVQLVRAYLDLMHMRMPDRLEYRLNVDESALALPCPPSTLLTLVENAVRHGIDPSEEGGFIDIEVTVRHDRCLLRVSDSGVGLGTASHGSGTGLTSLRERLRLMFGDDAVLRISAREPCGVCAEVELPAPERAA
jgi:Histidine kinase